MQATLTGLWMPFIGAVGYADGVTSHVGWTRALDPGGDTGRHHDPLLGHAYSDPCRRPSRPRFANLTAGSVVEYETGLDTTTRISMHSDICYWFIDLVRMDDDGWELSAAPSIPRQIERGSHRPNR